MSAWMEARRILPLEGARIVTVGLIAGTKILTGQRNDNGKWTNPGGHMDDGESLVQAAKREVWEESGIKLKDEDIELVSAERIISSKTGKPFSVFAFIAKIQGNGTKKLAEHKAYKKKIAVVSGMEVWVCCSPEMIKYDDGTYQIGVKQVGSTQWSYFSGFIFNTEEATMREANKIISDLRQSRLSLPKATNKNDPDNEISEWKWVELAHNTPELNHKVRHAQHDSVICHLGFCGAHGRLSQFKDGITARRMSMYTDDWTEDNKPMLSEIKGPNEGQAIENIVPWPKKTWKSVRSGAK